MPLSHYKGFFFPTSQEQGKQSLRGKKNGAGGVSQPNSSSVTVCGCVSCHCCRLDYYSEQVTRRDPHQFCLAHEPRSRAKCLVQPKYPTGWLMKGLVGGGRGGGG